MKTTASKAAERRPSHPKTAGELLGFPPAPKTGKDRLIAVAIELLYRRGVGAVGIDQVIAAAGVTKTTFYKHFESRDDLMVAAVRQRDEWESRAWMQAVRKVAGDDPRRQMLAMFDVMDWWFNAPDYQGCMFVNAAAEFPNPNEPVHRAAAAYKQKVRSHWQELAIAAGADRAAASTFADCYTALMEGAMVLRQTQGRNDAAWAVRPAVEQLMRTYLPEVGED
ncbi:MAG: TetR/AcrR family transcriptional regulator [Planctomycetes bacterium]|nr:TetR/AcrR family transcriptional regulator [Planctomycetota bacterium]